MMEYIKRVTWDDGICKLLINCREEMIEAFCLVFSIFIPIALTLTFNFPCISRTTLQKLPELVAGSNLSFQNKASASLMSLVPWLRCLRYCFQRSELFQLLCAFFKSAYLLFISFLIVLFIHFRPLVGTLTFLVFKWSFKMPLYRHSQAQATSSISSKIPQILQGAELRCCLRSSQLTFLKSVTFFLTGLDFCLHRFTTANISQLVSPWIYLM